MNTSCDQIWGGVSVTRPGRNSCSIVPHTTICRLPSGMACRSQPFPRKFPQLHGALIEGAKARGWKGGRTFVIRHCRVGILNEIGELLIPEVAVLLIGERPGLATAESLSAYMAYRPRSTHTDANRNLISNIHARGVSTDDAVARILNLAGRMMKLQASGYSLREELPALGSSESFI